MADNLEPQADEQRRVSRLSAIGSASSPDEVVREYEARYEAPRRKAKPRSYSTMHVTDDERLWASLAHASIWITMLSSVFSLGLVTPLAVCVPLYIYFQNRRRSDYVAFHAMQAFVLQLIATVGLLLLTVVGGLVWLIGLLIALVLVMLLVGFVLVPLWAVVGIVLALVIGVTPLAALLFGTIAAVQTYQRRDYRYPLIAAWVDRQLAGGLLNRI